MARERRFGGTTRRDLIRAGVGAGVGMLLPKIASGQAGQPSSAPDPLSMRLTGQRVLTFNSYIRVHMIEVTREKSEGPEESDKHTPANVAALREAFGRGWPGGRMTWGFSWRALEDQRPNYREIRKMVRGFHERYGDDVTFLPSGYFPNAYNSREQVDKDLHEGLAMASDIVGGGYRPKSVIAGFLAADNLRYLAETEGIHVCQGNIWSQYAIDNQDGDGSISYPYYPSQEHFCKPAQGRADFIDCVNLDGWTMDFLAARREGFKEGFNSRMGVGPIETVGTHGHELGLRQMMETTAAHFDTGFKLNGWAWVTNCWEVSLVPKIGPPECLARWLSEIRKRWPEATCVTQGEFGLAWRRQYRDNEKINYRFVQRGTGIGGSDADLEIRWFMNKTFRLGLLRDWKTSGPEMVVDFTRYDQPVSEPQELTRQWSLLGRINQKQTRLQDKPILPSTMEDGERKLILALYPELADTFRKRA